jgi:hypothetical protein
MRVVAVLLLLSAIAPCPAAACSVPPDAARFEADSAAFDKKYPDAYFMDVPAPRVVVARVTPATSDISGSCSAMTWVDITVSLPPGSQFHLADLGFVFRSVPEVGRYPTAFPNFPIVSGEEGNVAHFRFGFDDRPAERKQPFKLRLEVFAITKGLQVGPSTFVFGAHSER